MDNQRTSAEVEFNLPLTAAQARNLIVFLERVVCHEGDKKYPPRFTADYIREEARQLLVMVCTVTGYSLEDDIPVVKETPPELSVCKPIWSSRGVCQLCGKTKADHG